MFVENYQEEVEIFTEEELTGLPTPVQNWLRQFGVVGKEKITAVRLKQEGNIRIEPGGKWLLAEANQYFTTVEPAFIWQVKVNLFPFVGFVGRKISASGEAVWQLDAGEYSYYQFEITELDYNQPEVY